MPRLLGSPLPRVVSQTLAHAYSQLRSGGGAHAEALAHQRSLESLLGSLEQYRHLEQTELMLLRPPSALLQRSCALMVPPDDRRAILRVEESLSLNPLNSGIHHMATAYADTLRAVLGADGGAQLGSAECVVRGGHSTAPARHAPQAPQAPQAPPPPPAPHGTTAAPCGVPMGQAVDHLYPTAAEAQQPAAAMLESGSLLGQRVRISGLGREPDGRLGFALGWQQGLYTVEVEGGRSWNIGPANLEPVPFDS